MACDSGLVCRFERHSLGGVLQTSDSCFYLIFLCISWVRPALFFFAVRLGYLSRSLLYGQQLAVLKRTATTTALRTRFDLVLLDLAEAGLAAMVKRSGDREARNCDRMASSGFPSVLALVIATVWRRLA